MLHYLLALLLVSPLAYSNDTDVFLTIDKDALSFHQNKFGKRIELVSENENMAVVKIDEEALPWISMFMHKEFNRCGGFVFHEDQTDALDALNSDIERKFAKNNVFADYQLNRAEVVGQLIGQVTKSGIEGVIEHLSNYHTRYYTSQTGIASSKWIGAHWDEITKHRTDASVELFSHRGWPQETPILTIQGKSDEVIVIGGHADSIAGFFGGGSSRAPGADDNASGIATITEIIKVLVNSQYRPEKTIKFMAYAAEEVGLRGSKEIAEKFKRDGVPVIGVLQLDMTNFKGSDVDIAIMTDFTNNDQNTFLAKLIDTYLPELTWTYDKCGYGCSDHASWHNQGFPASIPFESRMRESNKQIHTARDLMSVSRDGASHATKFAKLGLAFIAELDKGSF
jgi:leucyl aminopeptidase